MSTTQKKIHQEIMFYTYPKLYKGLEWYVGFQAYDPALGKMRRKKIKVNFIEKIGERRKYADGLIRRIISNLDKGLESFNLTKTTHILHTDGFYLPITRCIRAIWDYSKLLFR